MSSSLAKNFAIAFYRYRMWLDEQEVPLAERKELLLHANHFLAYMTFSETNYRPVFQREVLLQKAKRAYRRFLRESMNMSSEGADAMLASVQHFCEFTAMSAASSKPIAGAKPATRMKPGVQKPVVQKTTSRQKAGSLGTL